MVDTTLYETTTPSEGSLSLAHQRLIRLKLGGTFVNITGDINNLALNPTPIKVPKEVYGQKGRTAEDIIGYNYAPTFNVEVVRDPVTKQIVASQAWFRDLVAAAFSTGAANKRTFQIFTDALDEQMPVLEGSFSVAYSEANTGYADKGIVTITLTSNGVVPQIPSPLAGNGAPVLDSASPAGRAPGDLIVVRGYKLSNVTAGTMGGKTIVKMLPSDDYTMGILVPATVTGSSPIVLTNSVGASNSLPYTAA